MTQPPRVALVTGAGSGIGRATALALAREGVSVACVGTHADALATTVAQVHAGGGTALAVVADVTVDAQVAAAVAATVTAFGGLDLAVNNAGLPAEGRSLHEVDPAVVERLIAVNLGGVITCLRHQLPALIARGGGAIVNTASTAGLIGSPGAAVYTATKHAVVGLTKAIALEYAGHRIRANAVAPGAVDTGMLARFTAGDPQIRAYLERSNPMQRIGTPDEIAAAIVWLASPSAAYVNGHTLVIDGGSVAA